MPHMTIRVIDASPLSDVAVVQSEGKVYLDLVENKKRRDGISLLPEEARAIAAALVLAAEELDREADRSTPEA